MLLPRLARQIGTIGEELLIGLVTHKSITSIGLDQNGMPGNGGATGVTFPQPWSLAVFMSLTN